MTAPEQDTNWGRVVRPYTPAAAEPGPKASGLTLNWAEALAAGTQAPEAVQAPEPVGPRHARRRAFLASVVRVITLMRVWAGAALIATGMLLVTAGTAVKDRAV